MNDRGSQLRLRDGLGLIAQANNAKPALRTFSMRKARSPRRWLKTKADHEKEESISSTRSAQKLV